MPEWQNLLKARLHTRLTASWSAYLAVDDAQARLATLRKGAESATGLAREFFVPEDTLTECMGDPGLIEQAWVLWS